jgi:hypothetical protein
MIAEQGLAIEASCVPLILLSIYLDKLGVYRSLPREYMKLLSENLNDNKKNRNQEF